MLSNNRCRLCSGDRAESFMFGLVRCCTCGLIVDPEIFRAGAAAARNLTAFGDDYQPQSSFWIRWFDYWKNRRYLSYLRRVGALNGRLLEIGVGSGSFLQHARVAGFEVAGCDLSEVICRRIQSALKIHMHCSDVDSLPRGQWDVVVMNHVVEHVEDPVAFLRAARERLRPGGSLHIAVPNVACWEARLPGWNSYERYHLAYFNGATLHRALRAAGFTPVLQFTHETFSGWSLAILRTFLRPKTKSEPGSGDQAAPSRSWLRAVLEHPYRFAMVSAGLITWPLRALQGAFGWGDELVVVARA